MAADKVRAMITGATGMVGEGVLHECLEHPDVEQVLAITRKPCGVSHPKLKEIILSDFMKLSAEQVEWRQYNACFFCLGVSSVGMKEEEYRRITYDVTMHAARLMSGHNPGMVFCYVTGMGTDSTEQGRSMWARVKGRTENELLRLPFRAAYMFRPGYIHPTEGLSYTHSWYRALSWMYPGLRRLFPGHVNTLKEVGLAMIHAAQTGYPARILEPSDIRKLANGEG
ncbi:hypothetical protein SK3146_00592 [Paenibacillus konkukensis]|uniref:Epimerase n=1 Tax=Paenibacillus konkukensis TaxID=2020716 RepID=A0ABY4RG12_9BACL|nr:epimerase [Paenibacillus konkukensis]UQZ81436.1 hypothetical protein SK3146_00592 [Paenibacillus konkukensis]